MAFSPGQLQLVQLARRLWKSVVDSCHSIVTQTTRCDVCFCECLVGYFIIGNISDMMLDWTDAKLYAADASMLMSCQLHQGSRLGLQNIIPLLLRKVIIKGCTEVAHCS